jgi:hypothetical protein
MGLWRCQRGSCSEDAQGRSIFDFQSEKPICPKCKTDMRKDPHIVIKLECVHFERVVDVVGVMHIGSKELACKPGEPIKPGTTRCSSAKAVNCPECRKTAEWRQNMEATGQILEDKDYPIEIDMENQVIRKVESAPAVVQDRPAG